MGVLDVEDQLELIWRILTTFRGLDPSADGPFALTFAMLAFVVGVLAVALDLCYSLISGTSFLRIKHGWRTIVLAVAWPLGAAVFGWFGLALNILQPTLLGCIAAAIAWKLLIDRAISSLTDYADFDAREER